MVEKSFVVSEPQFFEGLASCSIRTRSGSYMLVSNTMKLGLKWILGSADDQDLPLSK